MAGCGARLIFIPISMEKLDFMAIDIMTSNYTADRHSGHCPGAQELAPELEA